jgi:hypothetical protein
MSHDQVSYGHHGGGGSGGVSRRVVGANQNQSKHGQNQNHNYSTTTEVERRENRERRRRVHKHPRHIQNMLADPAGKPSLAAVGSNRANGAYHNSNNNFVGGGGGGPGRISPAGEYSSPPPAAAEVEAADWFEGVLIPHLPKADRADLNMLRRQTAGLYELRMQLTHSLKAPGPNP